MAANATRIPTINDLRVKLCYICREEECADAPQEGPPRAWTHPCTCTLIAHEQCLLKWIQTSQATASRVPNALKCPQCGTKYEMESDEPVILKALASGNKVLQRAGRYFTVFAAAAAVGIVGTSIYITLTAYGAWAVEKFIGRELFDVLLTDDPVNWPFSAYINLQLIPVSLIYARFKSFSSSALLPLLIACSPAFPVGDTSRQRMLDYWSQPENISRLTSGRLLFNQYWPPPPIPFGILGVPFVSSLYNKCYAHVYSRVLGVPLPAPNRIVGRGGGGLRFDEGPFVIRIRANLNDGGPDDDDDLQEGADANAQNANDNPNGQQQNQGQDQDPAADADQDPNAAVVQAAEQLIEINTSSLGRRVAGALIIPYIASSMGKLLFNLSKHSNVLRSFLGIRARVNLGAGGNGSAFPYPSYPYPPWARLPYPLDKKWSELSLLQQTRFGARLILNAFFGGTKTWEEFDPVWWRNAVGFGLFVVVKDCIQLLHLWLAKRELESRRVKDRDFKGVDIRALDLLPSFFQPAQSPSS